MKKYSITLWTEYKHMLIFTHCKSISMLLHHYVLEASLHLINKIYKVVQVGEKTLK